MNNNLQEKINHLLDIQPYSLSPQEHEAMLLDILQGQIRAAVGRHSGYKNYVKQYPIPFEEATKVSDLPYLPVRIFKTKMPISLVDSSKITRVLASSATTSQMPSRIALDMETSTRMGKGISNILIDFIGKERRPYLVIDVPNSSRGANGNLGARGAAIRGLQPFAKNITHCLVEGQDGEMELDIQALMRFAEQNHDTPVLVYGFTYILWLHLVKTLRQKNICLNLSQAFVLHSGGWKRLLEEQVDKEVFSEEVSKVFGCNPNRVIDFYGLVENVGIIYPDCAVGNKHAPVFGEVIVRSPLTLNPVGEGQVGVIQVCSALPSSFPGHLLLTEDMARVIHYDYCGCGRRGVAFRFEGRMPKSEIRGCGNIYASRSEVLV